MSQDYFYTFPAVRGIQAGMEYYISMCPMRLIPKIFIFDEEELMPELRAQRVLNKARIPEISTYLIENPHSYVFSSLTASIDGTTEFISISADNKLYNIGHLRVPMSARFLINDGQHRRAAIEAAIKKNPGLGDETISIVFFIDLGLKRSQQMFSDLNRYAIRTTKSLSILYDNRDPFAIMVKDVTDKVPAFTGLVETEKSSISNRSHKIFTLSGIYHATVELLKDKQNLNIEDQKQLAIEFWRTVSDNIQEWNLVKISQLSAVDFRKNYISAHSIALVALGNVGSSLLNTNQFDWKATLSNLKEINWHRENTRIWEGRITINGKISATRINQKLISNYIKNMLGLTLDEDEEKLEKAYFVKAGNYER
jgi:DNA sulfur modification protein DndB